MDEVRAPVAEGDVLAGRYRVEKVLAAGGMGVVVAARHTQLGQRVALKFLLHAVAANSEAANRFQREARAAALLRSEHVARVIDVGQLESGAPYMVMEFLEGCDLAEIIERDGRLPIEEAVEYVLQACEGLAEAHAARIVHRDLKPSNLFRTLRPDGTALIKILDFGISKIEEKDAVSSGGAMTSTTAVLGSPLYMSPEQMESSKNVDPRTDIWSLGVVLQQLLTGRPAFDAETLAGLCVAIATKPPTPLRVGLPNAPPELEAVVAKCLEKRVDARYQNVAELAGDLAPFAPQARTHVDRTRRLLLGATAPPLANDSLRKVRIETNAQTQTDPLGRTRTALAGAAPNLGTTSSKSMMLVVGGAVAVLALVGAGVVVGVTSRGPKPAASGDIAKVPAPSATPVNAPATLPTLPVAAPDLPVTALPTVTATHNVPATAATHGASAHPSAAPAPKPSQSSPPASTGGMPGFSSDRK